MTWVDPADDDDSRVASYVQPTALDAGFCSPGPAVSVQAVPVCTPLVGGVGVPDDPRPSSNLALQLIDYVPARPAPDYGHLPARGDVYRPTTDPFTGDIYRAFSVPTLKSELI